MSVLGLGEVVVVVAAVVVKAVVVVVVGQLYSGHGQPFGHPYEHGHRFKFAFQKFNFASVHHKSKQSFHYSQIKVKLFLDILFRNHSNKHYRQSDSSVYKY